MKTESVETRAVLPFPPERVWEALMFFEEIQKPPPLLLRMLLPRPLRTEGRKSQVGDRTVCLYDGGRLVKRVTESARGRRYAFEVVEQDLEVGGGIRLLGGAYGLRALARGGTEVSVVTTFSSPNSPSWLWGTAEAAVCRAFHRHILASLRAKLEAGMLLHSLSRARRPI